MEYNPDKWVLVKVTTDDETFIKVFATWYGGYLGADSWKLNSGCTDYSEDGGVFSFVGSSGSVYVCPAYSYGLSMYGMSVIKKLLVPGQIELVPENDLQEALKLIPYKD